MSLTPKERVIAQINHQETDILPYTLDFEGDVAERLDGYYGGNAWREKIDPSIRHLPRPSVGMAVDENAKKYFTDLYGSIWRVDARPWHMETPALKEPSLANYTFPTVDECFEPNWGEKARKILEDSRNYFVVGHIGMGLFERTWSMRGFEDVLVDSALNQDFYEELLDKLVEHQLAVIDRILALPIDGMMFSDDWGYQRGILIGANRWRKLLKPRLALLFERVHAAGKYTLNHCCGSVTEIMPDLIEIGLDVLESVQPEAVNMNPYELKKSFGEDITFWGALGSQSTIPFSTPMEIKTEVAKLSREMSKGGGYILAPAKMLQPDTPTENAAAVVEAFLEQVDQSLN